jgi:XcyI restriction endonuclease
MISVPAPELQINFANSLSVLRPLYLQDALSETVRALDTIKIDRELAVHVSESSLAALAAHGLRGEMIFPVPTVLIANPRLLGYYRLLYGYSQKEFYTSTTGISRFKSMEVKGIITNKNLAEVADLCEALCRAGMTLLAGIGHARISSPILEDLAMLTLGPQLRGGANVKKGSAGILTVFNAIHLIVETSVVIREVSRMEITNAAGRKVLIEFAPDPDIIIREEMRPGTYRNIIAIEVKAGSDFSNIHNRVGEAEKSHQKARATGYVECWTVVNVDKMDMAMAHRESPTTNRFYLISDLIATAGPGYQDFRDRVISLTGITWK